MTRFSRSVVGVFTLAAAASLAGCNKNNSPTVPTAVQVTEDKTGTVPVGGKDQKNFTVNYTYDYSSASVKLNSLKLASGADASTTIGVGFGSIAFDGSCVLSSQATANAMNVGQTSTTGFIFSAGNFCTLVFDSGTLTNLGPVTYSLTIVHY